MRRPPVIAASLALLLVACVGSAPAVVERTLEEASPSLTSAPTPGPPSPTPEPSGAVVELADAPWVDRIDAVVAGTDVAVAVGAGQRVLYLHAGRAPRTLASNQKLLTSVAALDVLGPRFRFITSAATDPAPTDGVIHGDLWLIGSGDPTLTEADLAALARRLHDAGVRRIDGDVLGDTAAFDRGWWAPGWTPGVSRSYVARPTALRLVGSYEDPEPAAAAAFLRTLAAAGIEVGGNAGVGDAPASVEGLAAVRSPALMTLLVTQNQESANIYAELITKALGIEASGKGSTAAGARAIATAVREIGVRARVRDGSGLSELDRASALGVVTLLLAAERESWFPAFGRSLAPGGGGTLDGRLADVPVRAKTGTLFVHPTSTLSGYVTDRAGKRIAFSVLTRDLPQGTAEAIEDRIVRILAGARVASSR